MYTIDSLIDKLVELKAEAKDGGETLVAITIGNNNMVPPVLVELTPAKKIEGICGTHWRYTIGNNLELLRIV